MELESPAFRPGEAIPRRYTKDGENVSPPLEWHDVPDGARELALVLVDTKARDPRPFTHWVVYGLAPERRGLPEGLFHRRAPDLEDPVRHGGNDLGNVGYDGPQPPLGRPHEYRFTLYAIDEPLDAGPGLTSGDLERRIEGHVLAEAALTAQYERPE